MQIETLLPHALLTIILFHKKGFTQSKSMCLTLSFERSLSIPLKTSEKQRFSDVFRGGGGRSKKNISKKYVKKLHAFHCYSLFYSKFNLPDMS